MPNETIEKLDEALSGIKKVQDICDRNSTRIDTLDETQIEKINEMVTKNLEEFSTVKATQEKLDESMKDLEKAINRPGNDKAEKGEISEESKTAFIKYLRNRSEGGKMSVEALTEITNATVVKFYKGLDKDEIAGHVKDMVVGVNPNGGYFVRPEFANFVIDRQFETSPMRQLANIQTISTESLEIPIDDDEAGAEWVGEVDTRSKTDTPDIGQLVIHTHELSAKPYVTQKLLDDAAFDIEAWLQTKVADKFTRTENTSFVEGNGSKRPRGFLTYSDWTTAGTYERGAIEQRDTGSSGTFDADNLIDLQSDLLEFYQPNATWVMERKTFGSVVKLKNAIDGTYLINPELIAQSAPRILLGRPVRFFDDMPTIAANSLSIAYGDFQAGYTIVDRLGIRILVDPYTAEPFIVYKTRKRVGGDVTNYQSIKILKLST